MHNFLIPAWFFGIDSMIYLLSAFVGFLLSMYFHKIFSISEKKQHMYLHLGFITVSLGFLILSVSGLTSYVNFVNCGQQCSLGLTDNMFSFEDFSYFLYFGLSLVAYMFFVVAYTDEYKNFAKVFVPLFIIFLIALFLVIPMAPMSGSKIVWHSYSEYFHLTSFMVLVFISFKNFVNYAENKSRNSLFVTMAFAFMALFHLFQLFVFFNEMMYVISDSFMLIGFVSLLSMIMTVKRK